MGWKEQSADYKCNLLLYICMEPLVDCSKRPASRESTLYDWRDTPDWARWAATDKDGMAFWYHRKPDMCVIGGYWTYISMRERARESQHTVLRCVDWKDSLEQRPC